MSSATIDPVAPVPTAAGYSSLRFALAVGLALTTGACRETLDAGHSHPHGPLPVDERNPVILYNDAERDNWFGEYAVLFANNGRLPLAGLIVTASSYWPDLTSNTAEWKDLLDTAQSSGLKNLPSITASAAALLKRPADGVIETTTRNESAGANLILNLSRQMNEPARPLVVMAGTRLTDIADAYLIDNSVVNRVVVVASLGGYSAPTATMDGPNGELDPWADWIVAHRFRYYVQVSAFYQQTSDVAASDVASLPTTPFGDRMRGKQQGILPSPQASDQVAVLSVALPDFAAEVKRFSPDPSATFDSTAGPPLSPDPAGNVWGVTKVQGPLARGRLWEMLLRG